MTSLSNSINSQKL